MYFGVKRLLGYSTDMFWTSSPRNIGKCPRKTHVLTSQFKEIVSKTIILFDGMDNRKCLRWGEHLRRAPVRILDRKSTRLNSSHVAISYAVFCLKKKNIKKQTVLL